MVNTDNFSVGLADIQYAMMNSTMRLNTAQRSFAADKLMDSANLALAGLVFGQMVADIAHPFLLILGLLLYLWGWYLSLHLRKGAK